MNQFFVKNQQVALSLDPKAEEFKKVYYECCPFCDEGYAAEQGFIINTPLTRSELQKKGIMVSSIYGYTR